MLAFKAGVPMLPVAVKGARGVFGKITVNVGRPVPSLGGAKVNKTDLEKASDRIMEQISALLDV